MASIHLKCVLPSDNTSQSYYLPNVYIIMGFLLIKETGIDQEIQKLSPRREYSVYLQIWSFACKSFFLLVFHSYQDAPMWMKHSNVKLQHSHVLSPFFQVPLFLPPSWTPVPTCPKHMHSDCSSIPCSLSLIPRSASISFLLLHPFTLLIT